MTPPTKALKTTTVDGSHVVSSYIEAAESLKKAVIFVAGSWLVDGMFS